MCTWSAPLRHDQRAPVLSSVNSKYNACQAGKPHQSNPFADPTPRTPGTMLVLAGLAALLALTLTHAQGGATPPAGLCRRLPASERERGGKRGGREREREREKVRGDGRGSRPITAHANKKTRAQQLPEVHVTPRVRSVLVTRVPPVRVGRRAEVHRRGLQSSPMRRFSRHLC